MEPILYVVIPCYNEEEVITETTRQLTTKLEKLIADEKVHGKSRVLYVNDGSKDKTWDLICDIHQKNKLFAGVNLSRNKGHQNALLAGLLFAKEKADITISMDADLQDDIDVIDAMLDKYDQGYDVVYGVRSSRETDTFFKKTSAEFFYKIMRGMGVDLVFNHADCRLMSKRAVEGLERFEEVNLFLRGIVPLIGFPSTVVEYKRNPRFAGESKYPLKKMIAFAMEGITSFTNKPIKFISLLGFLTFLVSIGMFIWILLGKLTGGTVQGWASILASVWLLGGLQLLSIGIIGEYIGKTYLETKRRPHYIIQDIVLEEKAPDAN